MIKNVSESGIINLAVKPPFSKGKQKTRSNKKMSKVELLKNQTKNWTKKDCQSCYKFLTLKFQEKLILLPNLLIKDLNFIFQMRFIYFHKV